MKCALITGITGQDGSCHPEPLCSRGREARGPMRRAWAATRFAGGPPDVCFGDLVRLGVDATRGMLAHPRAVP